jgi:hypothetical protein
VWDSALDGSLRDLQDAYDDLYIASARVAHTILQRFVLALDAEPLAGFLRATTPAVTVGEATGALQPPPGSVIGSGALKWPADRAERVAAQIALVRELAKSEGQLLGFTHTYTNSGLGSYTQDVHEFGRQVLAPLIRDIERLAENRIVPPILFDAIGRLPASGDRRLDELLEDALGQFRKPGPGERQKGVERLWDAWERLKTLDHGDNKRVSVRILLDVAASEPRFRALLEAEARALTDIGNEFQIRHFETSKAAIEIPEQLDYLFHRMFALMHLLLFSRARSAVVDPDGAG